MEENLPEQSAAIAPATAFAVAGRGRKQCSKCKQYVGVRTQLCPCGQAFPKADKPEQPKAAPDPTPAIGSGDVKPASARGRYSNCVYTPAGACPAKLTATDENSVSIWASEVRAAFENKNSFLRVEGLIYFVSHFYSHGSPQYKEAVAALKSLFAAELQQSN